MNISDLFKEQFKKELDNLSVNINEEKLSPEDKNKCIDISADDDICYETSCLYNSGCDIFEFNNSLPKCLEHKKDCPYKIESVDAF